MVQTRSDSTKTALVDAATRLFAEKGFSATSTREIASAAETNIASITYHFGGKEGLRMACAEAITDLMSQIRKNPEALETPKLVEVAETAFEASILRQANLLLNFEQAEPKIRFFFREIYEKSDIFEYIHESFLAPTLDFLLLQWADAIGISAKEADREECRLAVFSVISQIAYFRIGQPLISLYMKWDGYDREKTEQILTIIQFNIRAIIKAHRRVS